MTLSSSSLETGVSQPSVVPELEEAQGERGLGGSGRCEMLGPGDEQGGLREDSRLGPGEELGGLRRLGPREDVDGLDMGLLPATLPVTGELVRGDALRLRLGLCGTVGMDCNEHARFSASCSPPLGLSRLMLAGPCDSFAVFTVSNVTLRAMERWLAEVLSAPVGGGCGGGGAGCGTGCRGGGSLAFDVEGLGSLGSWCLCDERRLWKRRRRPKDGATLMPNTTPHPTRHNATILHKSIISVLFIFIVCALTFLTKSQISYCQFQIHKSTKSRV
jgi:hypothetical protein